MLYCKYTSLNTVTKSSNSKIYLLITISRIEEFSNRLLAFKKRHSYHSVLNMERAGVFQGERNIIVCFITQEYCYAH